MLQSVQAQTILCIYNLFRRCHIPKPRNLQDLYTELQSVNDMQKCPSLLSPFMHKCRDVAQLWYHSCSTLHTQGYCCYRYSVEISLIIKVTIVEIPLISNVAYTCIQFLEIQSSNKTHIQLTHVSCF